MHLGRICLNPLLEENLLENIFFFAVPLGGTEIACFTFKVGYTVHQSQTAS